jgi:nucleoside phosphorylase
MSDKQNNYPCIVFPMGIEAYGFLSKVEVLQRWNSGKTIFRKVFFEGRHFIIVRCGVGPLKSAHSLLKLSFTPSCIICAGSAGSLISGLKIGEVIISYDSVFRFDEKSALTHNKFLIEQLQSACQKKNIHPVVARSVTVREPVFATEERLSLGKSMNAVAVDMETHALRTVAGKINIPFGSIRVITDDIHTLSPPLPQEVAGYWRDPVSFYNKFPLLLRRRLFMKTFDKAMSNLHEILIEFLRINIQDRKRIS